MGGSDEQPANNVEITRIVRNMFFFIKILFIERIKPLILLDRHHYPMMRYGFGMGKGGKVGKSWDAKTRLRSSRKRVLFR